MLNWLFRRTQVRPSTLRDVHEAMRGIIETAAELRDDLDRLRAQHLKLRGRVYALWGAGEDPETTSKPRSLADPTLTKAEVRAALAQSGRLRASIESNDHQE